MIPIKERLESDVLIVGGGIAGIPGVIIGVPACSVLYTLTSKKTNEVLKKKQLDIR